MENINLVRAFTRRLLLSEFNNSFEHDEGLQFETNRLNSLLNAEFQISADRMLAEMRNEKNISDLKSTLDFLIDENQHKKEILENLMSIVQSLSGIHSRSSLKTPLSRRSSSGFKITNLVALTSPKNAMQLYESEKQDLQSKLEEMIEKTAEESYCTRGLQEMKANEWKNLQI